MTTDPNKVSVFRYEDGSTGVHASQRSGRGNKRWKHACAKLTADEVRKLIGTLCRYLGDEKP